MDSYNDGFKEGVRITIISLVILGGFGIGTWHLIRLDNYRGTIVDYEGEVESLRIIEKGHAVSIEGKEYRIPKDAYDALQVGDYIIVYVNDDFEIRPAVRNGTGSC